MKSSRFQVIIEGNEGGAIFDGGNAIAALKLFAQVGSGETYLAGHIGDGHIRMVGQQVVGHFHTYRVDILRKGKSIGILGQQVVKCMATDRELITDILTLQADIDIKTLSANGRIYGYKDILLLSLHRKRLGSGLLRLLINHTHQGAVLFSDYTLLSEEIKGEGYSQQG